MEETLVNLETAKLAFEKGFDLDCRYAYDETENTMNSSVSYNGNEFFELEDMENAKGNTDSNHYLAPSQSILQKWLRDKHKIFANADWLPNMKKFGSTYVPMEFTPKKCKNIDAYYFIRRKFSSNKYSETYEQALEIALLNALKQVPYDSNRNRS